MLFHTTSKGNIPYTAEEEAATLAEWAEADRHPTLEEYKVIKLKEANTECDKSLKAITDLYSESEMKTWVIQELEARNFQSDVDNLVLVKRPTYNIDLIITEKYGIPVTDVNRQLLVTRIIEKSNIFHALSSSAVGKRHKMADAIEDATTIRELEAIVF